MSTRASVEELMFELLTNPDRALVKRAGAAAFFFHKVEKDNQLVHIRPEELVDACKIILDESEVETKNTMTQKFWATVIDIIDAATTFIPEAEHALPAVSDIQDAFDSVINILLNNKVDVSAHALMHYYPELESAMQKMIELSRKVQQNRDYYGDYIR